MSDQEHITIRFPFGVYFVDENSVNIDDLIGCRPGDVVRCRWLPAVQYIPNLYDSYDYVAGMISDCA